MKHRLDISLEAMKESEIEEAVELIRLAMNPDEAQWARKTMNFYFACKKHGITNQSIIY